MRKPIPIIVLIGYLGSGRTTLVNRLLTDPQGLRIVVIVNDIDEINTDAALIDGKGHASVTNDSLVAPTSGYIRCALRTDLITQIVRLAKADCFDYTLIETSGICEPLSIAQSTTILDGAMRDQGLPTLCRLDSVITVVGAYRLLTEFSGGEALLYPDGETGIAQLLVGQIEFCGLVLLNKMDLLPEEETTKVEAVVKALQPSAQIRQTSFMGVPSKDILNLRLFDFSKTFLSAGWAQTTEHEQNEEEMHDHREAEHHGRGKSHGGHHHDHDEHQRPDRYGISTFVYYRHRPFHDDQLRAWVNRFPTQVIRYKGLVWIDGEDNTSFLLEQAGGSVNVQPSSHWLAAASPKEGEQAWQRDPLSRNNWGEQTGDRMTKLVFIEADMDEAAVCASLDECLA